MANGKEEAAKRAYLEHMANIAATQNLSEDLRPDTRNLTVAFTVLAAFFVGLRFFARWRQGVRIGADDWVMLFAMALLLGNCTMNLVLLEQGLGLHSGALTLQESQKLNRTVLGAEVLYVTAVNSYKISLLFLYFRVFPLRSVRTGGYICGGLSTAWNLACIFAAVFQCAPRNKLWEPWVEGTCINLFLTQLCISIPSILVDMAILCLPLPHVWRLNTNLTHRVLVTMMFLLGSYVVFTSTYRFRIFLQYTTDDVPYSLATGCAWNIIEISSGIVSGCLPTLGPLLRAALCSFTPASFGNAKRGKDSFTASREKDRSGKSAMFVTIGGTGDPSHNLRLWAPDRQYGISDVELVPSDSRVNVTVTVQSGNQAGPGLDRNSDHQDELPLGVIRQQREVEVTEERADGLLTRYHSDVSSQSAHHEECGKVV